MLRKRRFGLTLFLLLVSGRAFAADDLAGKIDAVLHGPDYKHAQWGILVVDSKTGATVYAHHPDQLCIPASVTKLYSCAAALIALGPDYRFETPVYRRGDVKDGKLLGDLILVASGDPTLGGRTNDKGQLLFTDDDHTYANSPTAKAGVTPTDPLAGLKALAKQVAASGIKHITGDVLIDDRLFAKARGSGSGPDLLTPIMVNDNVIDLLITPGPNPGGTPARIRVRPENKYAVVDANVLTLKDTMPVRLTVESHGDLSISLQGHVPVTAGQVVRVVPVSDPTRFARALFMDALRAEGIEIVAKPLAPPTAELPERGSYDKLTRVALYTSPPFSEVIKVTLKVSHNLYASTLPLLIAAKQGKRTLAEGMREQGKILKELGVDVSTISFAGGAGGMNADAVTPRATVQLLQAMAKRPEWKAYHAGFPVLGVDGTLATVVSAESPARGLAQAKTGTLFWQDLMNDRGLLRSKALGGVMTTKSGRALTFAMFVNGVPMPKGVTSAREGKVLGKLCEILHEHTP